MIAFAGAVVGVSLLYNWWNRDEEPASLPPTPPRPRTEAERLQRVITDEARKRIHFLENRTVTDPSASPPKMQMLCTLSQPYSWNEVQKELSVFCQTTLSSPTEAEKRVANWAQKVLETIAELNRRNQTYITCTSDFVENGINVREQVDILGKLINAQGKKIVDDLKTVKESETSSLEYKVYKTYLDTLNKINHPDRLSDLLSFIRTKSPMFGSQPVVEVVTSKRTKESDQSEEERLKKLVKEQGSVKALGVIEATQQKKMLRTAFIPTVVVCPKDFVCRTEVPKSEPGESFRKAIEGTCVTLNKEAAERQKKRETWPYTEDGSTWKPAPKTKEEVPVFQGNILTQQMDRFLDSVST